MQDEDLWVCISLSTILWKFIQFVVCINNLFNILLNSNP
jgi:hypothetical protein